MTPLSPNVEHSNHDCSRPRGTLDTDKCKTQPIPPKTVRFSEDDEVITYEELLPLTFNGTFNDMHIHDDENPSSTRRKEGQSESQQPQSQHVLNGDEDDRIISDLYLQHRQVRDHLRSTPAIDFQGAIQCGTKLPGRRDPKTKLPRWKYVHNGMVYITDNTSTQYITCYKDTIHIPPVTITSRMQQRHDMNVRILHHDDPQLCMTHIIIIMDQSGSMRSSPLASKSPSSSPTASSSTSFATGCGFKTRSQAAYGVLVLDYIARQLHEQHEMQQHRQDKERRKRLRQHQQTSPRRFGPEEVHDDHVVDDGGIIDAVTIIEMKNNDATVAFYKQPLDWILYNKLLQHQQESQPKSHGNYNKALRLVSNIVQSELPITTTSSSEQQGVPPTPQRLVEHCCGLQKEDLSSYVIIFISDGNPTDFNVDAKLGRRYILRDLCSILRSNLSFHAIGLDDSVHVDGCSRHDYSPQRSSNYKFDALTSMVDTVQKHNSESHGAFTLANLGSGTILSDAFSLVSSRTSQVRDDVMMVKREESHNYGHHNHYHHHNENQVPSSDYPLNGPSNGNHPEAPHDDDVNRSSFDKHYQRRLRRGHSSNNKVHLKLRPKDLPSSHRRFVQFTKDVSRWRYDHESWSSRNVTNVNDSSPWTKVRFQNKESVAFDMELDPFGIGAERAAYLFYEIDSSHNRLGSAMVAKASLYRKDNNRMSRHRNSNKNQVIADLDQEQIRHQQEQERQQRNQQHRCHDFQVHEISCRVQHEASELAIHFNTRIDQAASLRPIDTNMKLPHIEFLNCFVYDYLSPIGGKQRNAVLVEKYLPGIFTKYNGNQGYVKRNIPESHHREIELQIGFAYWTDFLQAFSHWVYCVSHHTLLVCDLQGVLNQEGIRPKFMLTDPCICSKRVPHYHHGMAKNGGTRNGTMAKRYGRTDLGMKGIRLFRNTHVCNNVCKGLGLPKFGIRQEESVTIQD